MIQPDFVIDRPYKETVSTGKHTWRELERADLYTESAHAFDEWQRLNHTVHFMLGCFEAIGGDRKHPATYAHIVRELKRCGLEV